jgi:hypothetical protein
VTGTKLKAQVARRAKFENFMMFSSRVQGPVE